jgi:hypothetical protein
MMSRPKAFHKDVFTKPLRRSAHHSTRTKALLEAIVGFWASWRMAETKGARSLVSEMVAMTEARHVCAALLENRSV